MVNALLNQQKADGAKAPMDELWENAETTDRGLSEPALVVDIDGKIEPDKRNPTVSDIGESR